MLSYTRWLAAASLLLPTLAVAAHADPPAEVAPQNWAYQAIEGLASRGLVHGYKDAKFLDGRKLSRFEMASLVKRVVDSLLAVPVPADNKPLVSERPGPAAGGRDVRYDTIPSGRPFASGRRVRTAAFAEADLGVVKRLADEYSVELAVIGVNLQETMDQLGALEGRVESIEESLRDPEGPLQTVINNVTRIDRIRFAGYLQARYEGFENHRERTARTPGGAPIGQLGPAPDRFAIRRMRFNVTARPSDNVGVRFTFDGGNTANGGPGLVGAANTEINFSTRDAYLEYYFTGNPATGYTVRFGQMNYPFGFELGQSSGRREAPERARVTRFFFRDERDRGILFSSATAKKIFWEVGLFHGFTNAHIGRNTNDLNNDKNVAGRVRTTVANQVDLGVSFDFGTTARVLLAGVEPARPGRAIGADRPYENTKFVAGADFQWFIRTGTVLRGEAMVGRQNGTDAYGYYLNFIQNIGKKNQVTLKYDWLSVNDLTFFPLGGGGTPVGDGVPYVGTASNLSLGWIHDLDPSTRVKLFYELHHNGQDRYPGVAGPAGRIPFLGNILRFEVVTNF